MKGEGWRRVRGGWEGEGREEARGDEGMSGDITEREGMGRDRRKRGSKGVKIKMLKVWREIKDGEEWDGIKWNSRKEMTKGNRIKPT